MLADDRRNAALSSLRAKLSNPDFHRGGSLDCFVAYAPRNDVNGGVREAKIEMKVIGLAGWSGAGKTTLLTRVLPHLRDQGLRVSVIKHAHHKFDVDVPGKDSWLHRQAGAEEVLVSSGVRWALMHELRGAREPHLPKLLAKLSRVDLVIVEGYKSEPHRKIEVHRAGNGKPLLYPDDAAIVGVVSDVRIETALPTAHLDDIATVAAMMRRLAVSIEEITALAEADS